MATKPDNLLEEPWIREAFPVLKEVTYLNVGTYGIMPEPALAEFLTFLTDFERRGVASKGMFGRKTEEARQRIAALIKVTPEEIAFTRNATDGINLVLAGINWQAGDELITTDQEHEAMMHPSLYLHSSKGIVVKQVGVSPDPKTMIDYLEKAHTRRTRLVAMSMVSCETGTRLPAREISQWATEHGVLCLMDGAQASGTFPLDMREISCDFYASNGHKWLGAPKGTGFFYGKREKLILLSPAHVGAGSCEHVDLKTQTADLFTTGQRFEFGTRAWHLTAGITPCLDWFEKIGWKRVYAHINALGSYLKESILERPYLKLLTPVPFEQSAGLTVFEMPGKLAGEISRDLRENWAIPVRVIPHYNAIRISTAHFNNTTDIDKLLEALDRYQSNH
jgi:selenocysteine lyase/cysteine desulfurase